MADKKMTNSLNIVMLLTDAFGGFGGISKFNRDFLLAADKCSLVQRIYAFPRVIEQRIEEKIPEMVVFDRRAAQGKLSFLYRLFGFALRGQRPDIIVCGHLNLLPAAWLFSRLRGVRLTLIIHGIDAWRRRGWLFRKMLRSVESVISVSRYSADRFEEWSAIPKERFFILPNCVNLVTFSPDKRSVNLVERYGLSENKLILSVGRLASQERYKGFDEVLDALPQLINRFPTLRYMIVGDGDDRIRLEQKTSSLGLSQNVIFAGRIPEEEKAAHYCLADAYVMPSYGEGFGIVFLEALACGIPVVGSRVDGSREALLLGKLGRLVDPMITEELIEAVTDVLLNVKPGNRQTDVVLFDVQHFNSRVATWLRSQNLAGK